jgi:hypothetical protein
MKEFNLYFNETDIIRQLCKIRVKIAKNRNKKHLLHLLTSNEDYNYHIENNSKETNEFEIYQKSINDKLKTLLPPRRQWVKIGSKSRVKDKETNEFLTSNDKNFYALLKTIRKHKKNKSKEQWFINLMKFVSEIQKKALSNSYSVSNPLIFPKLKEPIKKSHKEKNDCRPISMFSIEDRVILSLTNKFLTSILDKYFKDSSYAFRSKKIDNKTISHHNCIRDIIKYKKSNPASELYVIECDMKKFYDTVNHKIAFDIFKKLIDKVNQEFPELNLNQPIHIFKSFLNCYSFNKNVKEADNSDYWESYEIPNGSFPWVDKDLSKYYKKDHNQRIGVPQGGALSGLIANIYLNKADIALEKLPVLYLRFCDDMVVIHDDKEQCEKAKNVYLDCLRELKLFPHNFKSTNELYTCKIKDRKTDYTPFWNGKSKGPYKWTNSFKNGDFPWIAFVGYEINFNCETRVRKKSFNKEVIKQSKIINEIQKAIENEQRCKKGTAIESAINRLIGMSVGRIGLDNFSEVSTDMCWKNGFQELELNKHSAVQIKELDRNRSKLYYDLFKQIKELEEENDEKIERGEDNRQHKKYDKPFSYYYQILERKKNGSS